METRVASSLGLKHVPNLPPRAIGLTSSSKPAPAIFSQYKTALPLWRRGVQPHQVGCSMFQVYSMQWHLHPCADVICAPLRAQPSSCSLLAHRHVGRCLLEWACAQAPTVPQGAGSDVSGYSVYSATPSAPEFPSDRMGEAARKALTRATTAVKRYGWISFWVQLTLSVVSGVILLFSVAFTSQSGPKASLYLTLIGILAGFLSTFWNFSYTRTGLKMQRYLDAPPGVTVPKIKKQSVRLREAPARPMHARSCKQA